MSCYIDGTFVNERYFWASLQSLANQAQIARILEGQKALSLSVISDTLLVSSITEFGLAFVDDNNKILFNYKSVASKIQ